MYYIIDCIQGNSKVGDYIIQICYVASMYVGSIALVHRRLMAITIYLDYLHQVIILIDGILVIEGIGIILCTLVRYYVT